MGASCSRTRILAGVGEEDVDKAAVMSRYAVSGTPGIEEVEMNRDDSKDKSSPANNDFVLTNLADIRPGGNDVVDGDKEGKLEFMQEVKVEHEEGDELNGKDETLSAETKLKEYKEELKKKGLGTRKKRSVNSNIIQDGGGSMMTRGAGAGKTSKERYREVVVPPEELYDHGSNGKTHSLATGEDEDGQRQQQSFSGNDFDF